MNVAEIEALKIEINREMKCLKQLTKKVDGEIIGFNGNALNIVIPESEDNKELIIMTPSNKPILDNIKKAHWMLKDHIKSIKKSKSELLT